MDEDLIDVILDFAERHNISCPESVYQNDRAITEAPELIDRLMSIVGVYSEESL